MFALRASRAGSFRLAPAISKRYQSTLQQNPAIHVFPHPNGHAGVSVLTYLKTSPPNVDLAIGYTSQLPPTPESFTENHHFLEVLQSVVADNATLDPQVEMQAKAFASPGGMGLGSGGAFFKNQSKRNKRSVGGGGGAGGGGAGGASAQGGMGGAGVGGFVHVSDSRNPPDWGRIAWPEDIFGSLQVDGNGNFVGTHGNYQRSGTYRILTIQGILGLSPFIQDKLIERLQELENAM